MKSIILFLFGVFALLCGTASAEPTRAETVDWLKSKLSNYEVFYTAHISSALGNTQSFTVIRYKNISFEGGVLVYTRESSVSLPSGSVKEQVETVSARISDFSPECSVTERAWAGLVCEPSIFDLTLSSTVSDGVLSKHPNGKTFRSREAGFMFTDRKLAERVSKAFERLISLSGGKAEPF